jgi:hypothetical protein
VSADDAGLQIGRRGAGEAGGTAEAEAAA